MSEQSQKRYEILLIEADSDNADMIVDKFGETDLAVTIAEAKSLPRAEPLIFSSSINFIIFGPTLLKDKVLEFCLKHQIREKYPALFFKLHGETIENSDLLIAGISNVLEFPFDSKVLGQQLSVTQENFVKNKNLVTETPKAGTASSAASTSTAAAAPKLGEAQQLALILDKLSNRLAKISTTLRKLPLNTEITDASLPEAVNKVIAGATQIRREKEDEDINTLIQSIVKK